MKTKQFHFAVKADAVTPGRFSGRASVYGNVDSYGDVVMPGAFTQHLTEHGNRIKVLNQHNPSDVIGMAELTDSPTALLATGQLELGLQSARDAYLRLQKDLLDGISIGYEIMPDGVRFVDGIRQLHEIKLWEISLVTFPANEAARITDVKRQAGGDIAASLDRLAATIREAKAGMRRTERQTDPTIAALETELRKLNNAAQHFGADDPDVQRFAAELREKLDAAKNARSLATLLETVQQVTRDLQAR